jgi:hypothetical protein
LNTASKRIAASARNWVRKRDFYAGALMILLGSVAVVVGPTYQLGTLMNMGPGFMPTALGVVLIILGIIMAGAAATTPEGEDEDILPNPEWRGWACILAGPVVFIVLGTLGGLVPTTFGCVFVAAFGDREATLRHSALLAAAVSVFSIAVFHYLLQVPIPLMTWRGL